MIWPFVAAFFLAFAINPVVDFFQRKGARRDWAILTVYLVLTVLVILCFQLLIPLLVNDITEILQRLPVIFKELETGGDRLIRSLDSWPLPFNPRALITDLGRRGESILRQTLTQMGQGIIQLFSQSALLVLVPLLAYYISRDYPRIRSNIYRFLDQNLGSCWTRTFLRIDTVFRLYIRGQLLDTLAVSALFGVGLSILGFDAAFLLGMIAGVFNLIPYFGPVLGAIPIVIFALLKSPWQVFYCILLFFIVNQIEVLFLTPRIIGGNLGLHPVAIIFMILVGGKLWGLLGMVLAVPLGAILLILVRSFYEICFDTILE